MRKTKALILFLFPFLLSCNSASIATLDATIVGSGDVTGEESARVRVNFTDFTQPPGAGGNDQNLRASFSNTDGDIMTFTLAPVNGGFPIQDYLLDGSSNTFETTLLVTFSSGSQALQLASSDGRLTLSGVTINASGYITAISGDYHLNFDSGGFGQGSFSYSASE